MRLKGSFVAATRIAALASLATGVGLGQQVLAAKAGLIYFVRGQVSIAGRGALTVGAAKPLLNAGETLFSEAGHAEVLLNPGAVLRIGDFSRIRMDRVLLTDTRVSIESGSAVVTVNELPKFDRVEIHIGGAAVAMKSNGIYRFDIDDAAGPRLRVFRGRAEVHRQAAGTPESIALRVVASSGQLVRLRNLQLARFDRKDADELQQWAASRNVPPPFTTLAPMICYSHESDLFSILPTVDQSKQKAPQPVSTAEGLREWIAQCMRR